MKEIYFDNSATTKVSESAKKAANLVMTDIYGNPSSLHKKGNDAEKILKKARLNCAKLLGFAELKESQGVYFTAGGTESDNLAIKGILNAYHKRGNHIITSAIEHPAVLEVCKFLAANKLCELDIVDVDKNGIINIDQLASLIKDNTILVSIMQVNNETGAIQPIAEIGKLLAEQNHKIYFHVDGVQGFGKLKVNLKQSQIDLYSASAHKLHGLKGTGLLYVKPGVRIIPMMQGGGQENNIRSGTENMPGIAAFGAACINAQANMADNYEKVQLANNCFWNNIKAALEDVFLNNPRGINNLPYILNISFKNVKSEVLLHHLAAENIYVSSGSACAAKSNDLSHVLTAQGTKRAQIEGAIRFSFSHYNTVAEAEFAALKTIDIVKELRALGI